MHAAAVTLRSLILLALVVLAGCSTVGKRPASTAPVDPSVRSMPLPKGTEAPAPIIDQRAFTLSHMASQGREPVRIGMLLPLTGSQAAVGKALLDAAQLAIFESGRTDLVLMPHDTQGSAPGARAAAAQAIGQGAEILLGPLLADEVAAVTSTAESRHISVIGFSTNSTVARPGVFLLSFPPESEIERVIDFSVLRGFTRFAALIPQTDYGNLVEVAARAAVQKNNVTLAHEERYPPRQDQMFPSVQRLAANLDYTAVLLPDGGTSLRAIAPLLPYYGIDTKRIKVLGTGLWDDPTLSAEPSLVGGWFASPPPEARTSFATRFQTAYGRSPPRIASLAYDGVALVATLASEPKDKRFSVARLTDPNGFAGVDGIFRFRPDGRVERGLAVNEITPTGTVLVSPAPTTFQNVGY